MCTYVHTYVHTHRAYHPPLTATCNTLTSAHGRLFNMKRQSSLSSWLSGTKKPREASPDSNDEETESRVTDSCSIVSEETDELGSYESASTLTESSKKSFDGLETGRRDWCEVFSKKDGEQKQKIKFVRCKTCINYPSVVSMHCY